MSWSKLSNSGTGSSSSYLTSLQDVNVPNALVDGQVLTYNASTGKFEPKTPTGGSSSSLWAGKKWVCIGDSITYAQGLTAYHQIIASQAGLTAVNTGVSGSGFFAGSSTWVDKINNKQVDLTGDVCTVFLGTNDWAEVGKTCTLGSFGDTDPTLSFYGAVDYFLKTLAVQYQGKPIGVITPLMRKDAWGGVTKTAGITLTQVVDAIVNVANKYAIPVLDLYRKSNFNMWDSNFTAAYTTDGNLHPNSAGHQILARKILPFLNTL